MCPACLTAILGAAAGTAGGAGVLAWFKLHRSAKKKQSGPPTATLAEWIAAVAIEEALPATRNVEVSAASRHHDDQSSARPLQ